MDLLPHPAPEPVPGEVVEAVTQTCLRGVAEAHTRTGQPVPQPTDLTLQDPTGGLALDGRHSHHLHLAGKRQAQQKPLACVPKAALQSVGLEAETSPIPVLQAAGAPPGERLRLGPPGFQQPVRDGEGLDPPLGPRGLGLEPAHSGGPAALFVKMEGRRFGPFHPHRPRKLQEWNTACAVAAAALFLRNRGRDGPGRSAFTALEGLVLPGRFERLPGAPEVVLDGAHTPRSVAAAAAEAARMARPGPLVTVLGLAEDKNVEAVLEGVWAATDDAVFTSYPGGRALPPERLRLLSRGRGRVAPEPAAALRLACERAGPEGLVLVTGSLCFAVTEHAMWNLTQFFILGLPNSGFDASGLGIEGWTLLVSRANGHDLVSGGAFGIEASLLTTLVEVILILWLFRRLQDKPSPEQETPVTESLPDGTVRPG